MTHIPIILLARRTSTSTIVSAAPTSITPLPARTTPSALELRAEAARMPRARDVERRQAENLADKESTP